MIYLKRVARSWPGPTGTVTALELEELSVARGERLAVLGHNGSGKTTLLHLIAGLLKPDRGTVRVGGEDLRRLREHQLDAFRARTIGYLPHGGQLMDALTAEENVMAALFFAGVPRREHRGRAREALDRFGVAHRMGHLPGRLSAGERQRVALARAVVNRPSLLLVDEPTVNLDPESAARIAEELGRGSEEEGRTLILVTHHAADVGQGMRVLRLEGGREVTP